MTKHTAKTEENRRHWERLLNKIKKEMKQPLLEKLADLEKTGEKPSYIR